MNGIEFGKELKNIRQKVKYPSKELALEVGRAVTYVSQLERGLIKNPDYETCYMLLKELKFPEDKIDNFLDNFSIISPEREQAELKNDIEKHENQLNVLDKKELDENEVMQLYPFLYEDDDIPKLKRQNYNLHIALNSFIERDITRARKVLTNINALTKSKETFDFFCSLFQYDFFDITKEEKEHLISLIKEFNPSKDEIFDWEE
ncbi:helix-turn-helix domain-containing protein [Litchfieldia salsa]|uniref:Helix-turn-helix n=1 Tax=Litchfieldia salsa TaxID=930152 RepID=A0A1H0UCX7_9BACI|nr:helix-turn-helix transcriptional regulator [Litchfieldia salsa]SDP64162.1 Helix-turn-helix [Litchfieldia salsa]